jgi:hypothetical protein
MSNAPATVTIRTMSFRRSADDAHEASRWREFLDAQRGLFDQAGLPGALADREQFDYFLMHGYQPMPGGHGSAFDLDRLGAEEREAFGLLTRMYVDAFGDPGLDREIELLLPDALA